jgi:HTH-type transcriptional regulator/antitoxin HigA
METLSPISNEILNYYNRLCENIPLYPLLTEQDYNKAVAILNALLDAGGANENNPLARLVDALGVFIGDYENQHPFFLNKVVPCNSGKSPI